MYTMRVLGLAAGALLFGVQIGGSANAAAVDQAAAVTGEPIVAKVAYERQGVAGRATRGYYGAASHRAHDAHRYRVPARSAAQGGAPVRYHSRYPAPRVSQPAGANPRYEATQYPSFPPFFSDGYPGATPSAQAPAPRTYPARPVLVAPRYSGAGYAVATGAPVGGSGQPVLNATCVNGRMCAAFSYYRGAPVCRMWAACTY